VYKGYYSHICGKNAAYEHEGKWFCKTHHPPTVLAKTQARAKKYETQWAAAEAKRKTEAEKRAEIERKAAMYGELLEALKLLLDREWQDDDGSLTLEQARANAKAAIAKAEGAKV
jgi:hypothetical protein